MTPKRTVLEAAGRQVAVTNPDKVFDMVIAVSRDQISKLHQEMKEKENARSR